MPPSTDEQLLLNLGPLGQTAQVHLYTITCLGFTAKSESAVEKAKVTFETAATKICEIYPYLAGQVICEPPTPSERSLGGQGTLKVVRYPEHEGKGKFLRVKDCTSQCPKYADILQARAPTSMLDGQVFSPGYGFGNIYPLDISMPVIIMQLNVLDGGLILTICAQHNVMDGNANAVFIRQFAGLCCGNKPSPEQIAAGNADRTTIIPPLLPTETPKDLAILRRSGPSEASEDKKETASWPPAWPAPNSPSPWKTFRFSSQSLRKLRDLAMQTFQPTAATPYLSSDDILTGFLWTRLTASRSPQLLSSPKTTTSIIRTVNGRQRLTPPLSPSYMGFVIAPMNLTLPITYLLDPANFGPSISKVRETLLTDITDHHVRSYFHLLKTSAPTSIVRPGPALDPDTDFVASSFLKQGLYEAEFGAGLGRPDFVRRPNLPEARGLVYIMPKTREGDVDVVWGLTEEEGEALREDGLWKEYAEFLG